MKPEKICTWKFGKQRYSAYFKNNMMVVLRDEKKNHYILHIPSEYVISGTHDIEEATDFWSLDDAEKFVRKYFSNKKKIKRDEEKIQGVGHVNSFRALEI